MVVGWPTATLQVPRCHLKTWLQDTLDQGCFTTASDLHLLAAMLKQPNLTGQCCCGCGLGHASLPAGNRTGTDLSNRFCYACSVTRRRAVLQCPRNSSGRRLGSSDEAEWRLLCLACSGSWWAAGACTLS